MADFRKLDDIITELELHSKDITSFTQLYAELEKCKKGINDSEASLQGYAHSIEHLSTKLEQQVDEGLIRLQKQGDGLEQSVESVKLQITKAVQHLQQQTEVSIRNVEDTQQKALKEVSAITEEKYRHLSTLFESFGDAIKKQIKEMEESQLKFQRELDTSLFSRLEKSVSDIKVEVRNEGTQIQRGFENALHANFNQFQTKIDEQLQQHGKKSSMQQVLLIVLIAIGAGNMVITLLMR